MSSPSAITDDALRRRLSAVDFAAPPITDSTRGVLIKKLQELEKKKKGGGVGARASSTPKGTRGKKGGATDMQEVDTADGNSRTNRARGRMKLLEYSSAEDDEEEEEQDSRSRPQVHNARRRISHTNGGDGGSVQTRRRAETQPRKMTKGKNGRNTRLNANALLGYSEEEDESEGENKEDEEVDEDDVEEDGSEEEEEEDDDEDERNDRVDFCGQTADSPSPVINGGLHQRRGAAKSPTSTATPMRTGGRFSSSTPLSPPPRATSTYGDPDRIPSTPAIPSQPSSPSSSPAGTPPILSYRKSPVYANGSMPIVTQATPPPQQHTSRAQQRLQQQQSQKRSLRKIVKEWSTPQTIMVMAALFLLLVLLKYVSLRPNFDIENKLKICGTPQHTSGTCVVLSDKVALAKLHKTVLSILEDQERETLCTAKENGSNLTSTLPPSALAVDKVLEEVLKRDQGKREHRSESTIQDLFATLLKMLNENSNWGVTPLPEAQKERQDGGLATMMSDTPAAMLALTYGSVDWTCWLASHLERVISLFLAASEILTYLVAAAVIVYLSMRLYGWRRDRIVRQRQEVFELVEQILSLLVTQHQAATRTPPDAINRPTSWVAVNHVRDQLIPPQERKGRRRAWELAVKYIREQESRVREDVQRIYGEEHRVWQWIPDLHWSPRPMPGAPNPFLMNPQNLQMSPVFTQLKPFPQPPSPPTPSSSPLGQRPIPSVSVPSPSTSGTWQGSAFGSLSKNVAAPSVAPTACLKVRHLFDSRSQRERGWVVQVKEELLRRCAASRANILHIAVDTESVEGCVYVKCATTDDALKVFRALHGQWYRGQLVTAKYLREERYHERFPDARNQRVPMKMA